MRTVRGSCADTSFNRIAKITISSRNQATRVIVFLRPMKYLTSAGFCSLYRTIRNSGAHFADYRLLYSTTGASSLVVTPIFPVFQEVVQIQCKYIEQERPTRPMDMLWSYCTILWSCFAIVTPAHCYTSNSMWLLNTLGCSHFHRIFLLFLILGNNKQNASLTRNEEFLLSSHLWDFYRYIVASI